MWWHRVVMKSEISGCCCCCCSLYPCCVCCVVPGFVQFVVVGSREVIKVDDGRSCVVSEEHRRTAAASSDGISVPAMYVGVPCAAEPHSLARTAHSLGWDQHRVTHKPTGCRSPVKTRTGLVHITLLTWHATSYCLSVCLAQYTMQQ